ncbi:MAG: pantetheine-phosphate adenylyltransferase [Candidatus Poseidoniales archaeon]|nr:pantetheine-phosphate adenylyltransferase [Candidatus Poseidoniales archaeon]|tara:strand:+ start:978 stop:1982 length:1005 start_codon:yes stop_codon:yes gene_type:complete
MSATLCLVGGTFDCFHAGHQILLEAALSCDSVEVWVTSDAIAVEKDPRIKPQSERQNDILDWAGDRSLSTHSLEDSWGPAPTRGDATHIVCTPETRENCKKINKMRSEGDLTPLELVEVPHVLAEDGKAISSSRIRQGSINREGNLWIRESDLERVVYLPTSLDSELKEPMGTLFPGPEDTPEVAIRAAVEAIPAFSPCLIAVGDVTVNALLETGWVPDVGFVDGLTKRTAWDGEIDMTSFVGHLTCENPPGQLTPDLLECTDLALDFAFSEDGGPVLLEVEGEEDLAPIMIHLLAPLGTVVLYGQPSAGVVLRVTDESTKARCRALLDSFEVR